MPKPTLYQGTVSIANENYPFTEKEEVFERFPVATVKKTCVNHGCPHFLRINVKNDQYLRLVRDHSSPETLYHPDGYGWSRRDKALLFPNITLDKNGIVPTGAGIQSGPFHTLEIPKRLADDYKNTFANFVEETPIIFSIFSAMMPPLFSAAYRVPAPQTVVIGAEFALLQQIGKILGIPHLTLKNSDEAEQYVSQHRCPFLVRTGNTSRKGKTRHTWVDTFGLDTPAVVWTHLAEALARMSYGKTNLLILPNTHFYCWFDGRLPEVFKDCFVQCLQHLCRYVLDHAAHLEDWNEQILNEAKNFFTTVLGVAPQPDMLFDNYYADPNYFYDYVNILYRSELLPIEDNECIKIPHLASCYREHLGIFDFEEIYCGLLHGKAIKEYNEKKQEMVIYGELLKKSRRRLEKFFGRFLR